MLSRESASAAIDSILSRAREVAATASAAAQSPPRAAAPWSPVEAAASPTAAVSAADSYRWRTVGILCGFYVFSLLAKLVGRLSGPFAWVGYLSILGAYEPQRLVGEPAEAWRQLAAYDAVLIGVGVLAYVVGAVIFARRDLPAPL